LRPLSDRQDRTGRIVWGVDQHELRFPVGKLHDFGWFDAESILEAQVIVTEVEAERSWQFGKRWISRMRHHHVSAWLSNGAEDCEESLLRAGHDPHVVRGDPF